MNTPMQYAPMPEYGIAQQSSKEQSSASGLWMFSKKISSDPAMNKPGYNSSWRVFTGFCRGFIVAWIILIIIFMIVCRVAGIKKDTSAGTTDPATNSYSIGSVKMVTTLPGYVLIIALLGSMYFGVRSGVGRYRFGNYNARLARWESAHPGEKMPSKLFNGPLFY